MKIAKSSGQVSQSSSNDTHQFKISANGTAFQILSSGLYSNKHAAVLRELGCNAADAHVAAGIPTTPIVVTLPTETSRDLVIRDFGLGLSHEQVLSLYTTYFSSDKRDSNAFVGGLGLGSKSPFAYTNSFTVTSINGGFKQIYSCNIGPDGAPTVTRLSKEKTNDAQGIEVRLLTRAQDQHLFYREAQNVFQWFETPPLFNIDVPFAKPKAIVLKTPAYDIGSGYGFTQLVKMGNVTYPLQLSELDLPGDGLWSQLISKIPLVLKAPIGHLQVAASREALQYDPTTKKHLVQLYQQAYNDMARRIVAAMNDPMHTTEWAQECAVQEWVHAYLRDNDRALINQMVAQSSSSKDTQRAAELVLKKNPKLPTLAGAQVGANVYWFNHGVAGRKNVEGGYVSVGKTTSPAYVRQFFDTLIVVADDNNITEKMAFWRKEHNLPSVVLVSPASKKDLPTAKAHAKAMSDALGGVPVQMLSQMPLANVAVAPVVKRDYIEIDDRMVDVWNLQTASMTSMRFGDVPPAMRYVLVRDTTANRNADVVYFDTKPAASNAKVNTIQNYQLTRWAPFFAYVQKHGHAWNGPQGAIVLRPVDVERLKVEEAGLPWFVPSLGAALVEASNRNVVAFADTLWPVDALAPSWGYSPTKMTSGWLGDFGVALHNLSNQPNAKKKLRHLLDEAGLLESVDARAASTSPDENVAWFGYQDVVSTMKAFYPVQMASLQKPLTNHERANALIQEYPLLGHVSTEALLESLTSDAKLQQALNLLRVCLNLPIGVA